MVNKKKNLLHILFLITAFFSCISFLYSAEKSKESTKLSAYNKNKNKSAFNKIDLEILKEVEDGTPQSIKTAMAKFHKNKDEYTENEKLFIAVAGAIMQNVWTTEQIEFEVYPVSQDNPYIGAVNSSKNGVFDSSTGNVDFFATLLPTFVIFYSNKNQTILKLAEQSALNALVLNPNSTLANYIAGTIYKELKDYQKALDYFKVAYENSSGTTQICIAYADALNKNGKSELASTIMSTISGVSADDIRVLKQNAYIAYEKEDLVSAEEYVARVLQQTPNDLDFILFRAKIFIKKDDYIHAVSLLDMYQRQNDTSLEYLLLRATVQLEWSKNTNAATETVEKALNLYPDSEEALLLAARLSSITDYPVAGKYADDLAQLVLQKNPKNSSALIYALEGLMQRDDWEQAYKISNDLIKKDKVSSDVVYKHVSVCINQGKKNEAFDVANSFYNKNKDDELLIQAYVYAYTQINSRDSSLSLINNLTKNANQKMKSYLLFRRSFLQRTEDTILADLRSSLIANPRNSDALFRLYQIYYDKKDYRKAQYYLKQVVAINPNDSSIKKLNEALTQLIK